MSRRYRFPPLCQNPHRTKKMETEGKYTRLTKNAPAPGKSMAEYYEVKPCAVPKMPSLMSEKFTPREKPILK